MFRPRKPLSQGTGASTFSLLLSKQGQIPRESKPLAGTRPWVSVWDGVASWRALEKALYQTASILEVFIHESHCQGSRFPHRRCYSPRGTPEVTCGCLPLAYSDVILP
jgi:hypothetical protein